MTNYLVLSQADTGGPWAVAGKAEAVSAKAAILSVVTSIEGTDGLSFVAVPARSWKPVKVQVEKQLRFA